MVGPSKILTVSYGTFSCTLEGFDDPFSTMRGISEYFRDLAAEDRYFGAEPPTPDAEMLHRIAEREVHRRVEAHVEDGGVTLRQLEPDQVDEPEPAPGAVAPALAAVKAAAEVEIVEQEKSVAPVAQESVAAKLARIRAVVSDDAEDEYTDKGFAASPISAAFDDVVEEETNPELSLVVEPEVVEEVTDVELETEAENEVTDGVESQPELVEAIEETVSVEAVEIEVEEPVADDAAEVLEATNDDGAALEEPEADLNEGQVASSEDAISRLMAAVSTSTENEVEEEEPQISAVPEEATIARVVKMRRSDFEAAVAEGDLEEVQDEETIDLEAVQTAIKEPNEPVSSLSAADEAELMSTLEQVQREADAERRAEKEGRAMLENADAEADTNSVDRILEVTNSEMAETEGTRRRSAIAHLKAAVAATRADKFLKKKREDDEENDLNQYRDDLARVVRPKRPPEAEKVERRLAPLMLVSEQRIDETADPIAAAAASVVRPRRVTSVGIAAEDEEFANGTDENIFRDAGSFAEFAEEMGASELPDLLEAAAAYYAFVEGQEHFSRPQIMKAVASVNDEKVYSREEGLRSFGMLLRRGKIQKIKRGQFKIANSTRFNPEARAAGE